MGTHKGIGGNNEGNCSRGKDVGAAGISKIKSGWNCVTVFRDTMP